MAAGADAGAEAGAEAGAAEAGADAGAGAAFLTAFLAGDFFAVFFTAACLQQQQFSPLQQQVLASLADFLQHSCLACLGGSAFLHSVFPQAQPATKTDMTAAIARLRNNFILFLLSGILPFLGL